MHSRTRRRSPDATPRSGSPLRILGLVICLVPALGCSSGGTGGAAASTGAGEAALLAGARSSTAHVRVAVVGDINREGIDSPQSREGRIAASIRAWSPDAVAVVGDFQYEYGDCATLVDEFDRTGWGRLMPKVIGTAGRTHDYTDSPASAEDYSRHMEGTCRGQTSGASLSARRSTARIQPFRPHAVDLGAWRAVSLPSGQWDEDYAAAYGDRWSGSAITSWLRSTLSAARQRGEHVLVMTHQPYWTSATDDHPEDENEAMRPWIRVMNRFDARVLVSGHQHNYERFRPQEVDGTRNARTGVQQLQVSTGGIDLREFTSRARNSVARNTNAHGWLRLVLRPGGDYTWRFIATEGSYADSGRRAAP